jgi:hypothetical protein
MSRSSCVVRAFGEFSVFEADMNDTLFMLNLFNSAASDGCRLMVMPKYDDKVTRAASAPSLIIEQVPDEATLISNPLK